MNVNSRVCKRAVITLLCVASAFCCVGLMSAVAADAKAKKPEAKPAAEGDSLDDALLEGLTNELAEEPKQPRQRKSGQGKPSPKTGKEGQPPSDLERKLDGELKQDLGGEDIGAPSEDEDPLTSIGRRMRAAQEQIAKRDASEPTRKLQDGIVTDLARLIEAVKSQQPKPSGSSSASSGSTRSKVNAPPQKMAGEGNTSNQPARDASEKLRQDEVKLVDMAEMKSLLKDLWGELPDRAREQMLQSSVDKFLPKYEVLIEKYFRRLAEEENESPKK